jgi:hypothetical protein
MIPRECPLEVNLGPGGLCGAVFVDEAFLDLLKRKFDNKKWVKMTAETRHHLLHDEWEHGIKPAFDGREKTWKFNMPFECLDIKSLKAKAGPPKITLNTSEVRAVFDPVVDKIRAMVDDQVAAVRAKTGDDPKVL